MTSEGFFSEEPDSDSLIERRRHETDLSNLEKESWDSGRRQYHRNMCAIADAVTRGYLEDCLHEDLATKRMAAKGFTVEGMIAVASYNLHGAEASETMSAHASAKAEESALTEVVRRAYARQGPSQVRLDQPAMD